jgi:hypothetical protein
VATGEPAVGLWSVATGRRLGELRCGRKYKVDTVTFSPDGKTVAGAGDEGAIYVWDVDTGKELPQFTKPRNWPADWDDYFGGSVVAFSRDGGYVAIGALSHPVTVWEVATGDRVHTFPISTGGRRDQTVALAFSQGGRMLASGGNGCFDVLVWDLTGRLRAGRLPRSPLAPKEVTDLCADLASADAARADRAVWRLAATPGATVLLLKGYLSPAAPVDPERVGRLVKDLASDRFAVRDRATRQLQQLEELAEPALRRALAGQAPLETRRRVAELLGRLDATAPRRLRTVRSARVLEYHDTPEARALLEWLAGGAPDAWLTQAARASLRRLVERPADPP